MSPLTSGVLMTPLLCMFLSQGRGRRGEEGMREDKEGRRVCVSESQRVGEKEGERERGDSQVSRPISRTGRAQPLRQSVLGDKPFLLPWCRFFLFKAFRKEEKSPSSPICLSHSREFSGMEKEPKWHLFAVKNRRRRKALSAGKCGSRRGRLSPAAAAPVTNTGVMTLGHLIKSAALGPATLYPGVTASFFN